MKSWKIFLPAAALSVGLLTVAGCSSDPVAPQDTYDIDTETASEWSLEAIEMINQMAAAVPQASQGDFSTLGPAKSATEPEWDEAEMAWVLELTETFSEGDPPSSTGETRMSLWIQFRGDEGPLPAPLGATEMEYRQSAGMTLHSEHEQGTSDLEFDLATGMVVTYLETGYGLDGMGSAHIVATATANDRTEHMDVTMTWGLDLTTAFEGCPAGSAFVQIGQYRTDVTYDGQGNANWTMTGPDYQASGVEPVPCGVVQ